MAGHIACRRRDQQDGTVLGLLHADLGLYGQAVQIQAGMPVQLRGLFLLLDSKLHTLKFSVKLQCSALSCSPRFQGTWD